MWIPTAQAARFDLGDQQVVLGKGEWSEWLRADFRMLPVVKSASGILRIYLQQAHPYLRVYVSPVNIEPGRQTVRFPRPCRGFSRQLSDSLGPFYTQGIAEEISAYRAGLLNKDEVWCRATRFFPIACGCSAMNWRISATACCFTTF